MRLAWFCPTPSARPPALDPWPALISTLEAAHAIDRFDQRRAHDVVWMHHRSPYDLFVYELADTPAHAFIWPYLLHYPGIVSLHSPSLHESRALTLHATRRSEAYDVERLYSGWDLMRAPMAASRLTVVSHPGTAQRLQRDHPGTLIRHVPPGLDMIAGVARVAGTSVDPGRADDAHGLLRVGGLDSSSAHLLRRTAERLRNAGTAVEVVRGEPEAVLRQSDVVVAVEWPAGEWPMAALAAMAHSAVAIVLETAATAGWPALDPQSWQSRALAGREPAIAVSLDPRDEEHSLVLALRRLAADRRLAAGIAAAGHAWWRGHATLAHAVEGWRSALQEAAARPGPLLPADWPAHLSADGTNRARAILAEMGVVVDLLEQPS